MARINVEDSIFRDARFLNLCVRVGDSQKALGQLVFAWILAQRFYLSNDGLIQKKEWDAQGIGDDLIHCGLAELINNSVRMKGIDEQFAWLRQRSDAGKMNRPLTTVNDRSSADVGTRRETSSSSSSFLKDLRKKNKQKKESPAAAPIASDSVESSGDQFLIFGEAEKSGEHASGGVETGIGTNRFIAAYVGAIKKRFGENAKPAILGREAKEAKQVVAQLGLERAIELVEYYVASDEPWFKTRGYDLVTFFRNVSKLSNEYKRPRSKMPAADDPWNVAMLKYLDDRQREKDEADLKLWDEQKRRVSLAAKG